MINQHGFEIGVMASGHPFARVGKHRPPIVVLPGLTLDYRPPSWWVMSSHALGFHRLSTARTVYVVQRPRGLRPNTTLRELADEYAVLIQQEWGQADLMGLACGGAIAQHVGLNQPESVRSLTLVMSGAKLGTEERDLSLRWLGLAQTGEWARLREELRSSGLDGDLSERPARASGLMAAQGQPPDPVDAHDFVTLLSSLLTQDTSSLLPGLSMPTLVLGTGRAPFFPEAALREMAAAIPRSTMVVHRRGRTDVSRHPVELQDHVLAFLLGRNPAPEQSGVDDVYSQRREG